MGTIGPRTHVWNNALRSILILSLFPVFAAMTAYGMMLIFLGIEGWGISEALAEAWRMLPAMLPWIGAGTLVWFVIAFFANASLARAGVGARGVARSEAPELYNLLENLCVSQGMKMPRLAIIETPALNAFAAGMTRGQYTVAVTRGLMETLDRDELEAVLAHELAHIKNSDVRLMMIASIFVGILAFVADMVMRNLDVVARMSVLSSNRRSNNNAGAVAMLALIVIGIVIVALARVMAVMAQMGISRAREYMADMDAVIMTKKPDAMVSALRKISGNSEIPDAAAVMRPVMFDNSEGFFWGLFSTHPSIERRIAALVVNAGARNGRRRTGPWEHRGSTDGGPGRRTAA